MVNRTPLLIGGLAFIAASLAGLFLMLNGEPPTAMTAAAASAPPPPSEVAYADQLVDPAREPIPLDQIEAIPITVYLSPTCGCCAGWVEHIESYGFEPTLEYHVDLTPVKQSFLVPYELSSCHTGVVNGYIVEGHVPGDVIREFLAEAPAVRGIATPGMPVGSPGMEAPDGRIDPYEVVTWTTAGQVEVYARIGS